MNAFDVVLNSLMRIGEAMESGQFTRDELEKIITICDTVKGATQKTLDKGPISQRGEPDADKKPVA